jgi:hypothetical protein
MGLGLNIKLCKKTSIDADWEITIILYANEAASTKNIEFTSYDLVDAGVFIEC